MCTFYLFITNATPHSLAVTGSDRGAREKAQHNIRHGQCLSEDFWIGLLYGRGHAECRNVEPERL